MTEAVQGFPTLKPEKVCITGAQGQAGYGQQTGTGTGGTGGQLQQVRNTPSPPPMLPS